MTTYSSGQFAALIGKHLSTVQRWDREGVLITDRSPKGHRIYGERHLALAKGLEKSGVPVPERVVIAYTRVSSSAQRPDLRNQRAVLESFCAAKGLSEVEFVEEIGGGMNFHRPHFLAIVERISRGEVKCLVIAHRDRLARFGYEMIEHLAKANGCDILVLNRETHSPEQEMVEDLMTIVHCFSSRLYGLRSYRKALKTALAQDAGSERAVAS
jgi:predicted site-specific integrase-resolvase